MRPAPACNPLMKLIFLIFVFFVFGCNHPNDKADKGHRTRYPKDSADYKLIKCNIYIGKDGSLYDKKIKADKSVSGHISSVFFYKYLDKHYDDSIVQILLDSIIDIDSYVCFDSSSYSKDKNRCYYHYDNSDGGFRCILDKADPATFNAVKNKTYDAEDKKYKYKNGDILF